MVKVNMKSHYLIGVAYLSIGIIIGLSSLYGYILTFDMAWGPNMLQPNISSNTWLLYAIINSIPDFLSNFFQKLILIAIIIFSGYGAHQLIVNRKQGAIYKYAPYFAGFLYIFNPFVYTRLMAGQWLVLIGYALLPWFIAATWKFTNNPKLKTAWPVVAWLIAIGLTSIHTLGFAAVFAIVLFAFTYKKQLKKKLLWVGAILGVWLIINAIWLVPLLNGSSASAQTIDGFGTSQLESFATSGTIAGSPVISAILLTGFWADDQGRYSLPSDLGVLWYLAAILILALVVCGLIKVIQDKDRLGGAIAIAGFIGLVLAIGVSSYITAPLTQFLHTFVPFYSGYREPHKWLALLAVAYVYLGAMGISWLTQLAKEKGKTKLILPIFTIAMILPILFAPNLAWGAAGQLKSVQYPAGWEQVKEYLANEPSDTKILVLPWHMYLHVGFADRVVANPTRYYFEQDMIVGDNVELKGVPVGNKDELHRYVNNILLPQRFIIQDAGLKLDDLDVRYVMLLKEVDYKEYGWVSSQQGLNKVLENESLTLYKVGGK